MDFSKIAAQREVKASVTSSPETDGMLASAIKRVMEAEGRSKPGPKRSATSKRNDPNWRANTMYLREETKAQLERYLHLAKLDSRPKANHPDDQSELMDQALQEWLAKRLPKLESEVLGR